MRRRLAVICGVLILTGAGCSGTDPDATPATTGVTAVANGAAGESLTGEVAEQTSPVGATENSDDSSEEGREGTVASDRFVAVSAGGHHACGLRGDATLICWGNNTQGQADAPGGQFTAVTASWSYSCGLRSDATVECWGLTGALDIPQWQFAAFDAGDAHWCGLRTDGTIGCGANPAVALAVPPGNLLRAPGGQFTAVAAGSRHSCAVDSDATVVCWGYDTNGQLDAPAGRFTAVAVGDAHSCGLRTDTTITCWGVQGQDDVPPGTYTAVAAGSHHSCGLSTDGTIECWNASASARTNSSEGPFTAVTAAGANTCGLRADGITKCWGYDPRHSPPPGVELQHRTLMPPPPPAPPPEPGPIWETTWHCGYTVQPGDTTFSIATSFGVSLEDLIEANDLENPDIIYEGDCLLIPPPR